MGFEERLLNCSRKWKYVWQSNWWMHCHKQLGIMEEYFLNCNLNSITIPGTEVTIQYSSSSAQRTIQSMSIEGGEFWYVTLPWCVADCSSKIVVIWITYIQSFIYINELRSVQRITVLLLACAACRLSGIFCKVFIRNLKQCFVQILLMFCNQLSLVDQLGYWIDFCHVVVVYFNWLQERVSVSSPAPPWWEWSPGEIPS